MLMTADKKRHWWKKDNEQPNNLVQNVLDNEVNVLLDNIEDEFNESFKQHSDRLQELREALRAREERENNSG
jgi:hypothetical protein